jgi:hypothetical protein
LENGKKLKSGIMGQSKDKDKDKEILVVVIAILTTGHPRLRQRDEDLTEPTEGKTT